MALCKKEKRGGMGRGRGEKRGGEKRIGKGCVVMEWGEGDRDGVVTGLERGEGRRGRDVIYLMG